MSAVADLTKYEWCANDSITFPSTSVTYNVSFRTIDKSTVYNKIEIDVSNNVIKYGYSTSSKITVYSSSTWSTDADYQNISFSTGTDISNSALIDWLEANGTLTISKVMAPTVEVEPNKLVITNDDYRVASFKIYKDGVELGEVPAFHTYSLTATISNGGWYVDPSTDPYIKDAPLPPWTTTSYTIYFYPNSGYTISEE